MTSYHKTTDSITADARALMDATPTPPAPRAAPDFLAQAQRLLVERGKQYDKPGGERSMGKITAAFNAITGHHLSEADGWLLMLILKQVRQWQTPDKFHRDSAEDSVSYAALLAESLAASSPTPLVIRMPDGTLPKA